MPEITADSAEAIALELLITVARAEGVHLDKEKGGWSREKILVTYRQCLAAVKRRAAGGGTASASQLGRAPSSPAASDPSSFPTTRPRPILRDRTIDPSRRSRDKGRLSRGGVPARVPLRSPTTSGRAGASWVSGPTVYWTPPRDSSPARICAIGHKIARHGAGPMPPPMAGSDHRHAAIDVERLAGDVGGFGAGE